jgi:hypothetical protein
LAIIASLESYSSILTLGPSVFVKFLTLSSSWYSAQVYMLRFFSSFAGSAAAVGDSLGDSAAVSLGEADALAEAVSDGLGGAEAAGVDAVERGGVASSSSVPHATSAKPAPAAPNSCRRLMRAAAAGVARIRITLSSSSRVIESSLLSVVTRCPQQPGRLGPG